MRIYQRNTHVQALQVIFFVKLSLNYKGTYSIKANYLNLSNKETFPLTLEIFQYNTLEHGEVALKRGCIRCSRHWGRFTPDWCDGKEPCNNVRCCKKNRRAETRASRIPHVIVININLSRPHITSGTYVPNVTWYSRECTVELIVLCERCTFREFLFSVNFYFWYMSGDIAFETIIKIMLFFLRMYLDPE